MSRELMTPAQLAEKLSVGIGTLANWRYQGKGPSFIKIGPKKVLYDAASVDEWLNSQTYQGTADVSAVA